jgi:hypothetical protein
MNYRIKKVKRNDISFSESKMEITFDKLVPNTNIVQSEMVLKTSRAEAKNLINSLFELAEEFLLIAELNLEENQLIAVKQVDFKYHPDKGLGAQMTAELYLKGSNENLILKTPIKWEDGKANTDEAKKDLMSANLLSLLKEVQYETCTFIDYEKDNQIEMFQENNEEAA